MPTPKKAPDSPGRTPPVAMTSRAAPQQKRLKAPNCTHINMDRIYGRDQHCFVCGRVPSMGFLYVCRQDTTTPLEFYRVRKAGDPVRQKSALRAELEEIGLSESVIQTAESGLYTDAQLEKLKRQKLELKQTISDLTDARHTVNAAVALEEADRTNRPSTDGASSSTAQKEPVVPFCSFQACHTCRPYYKDRIYLSFPAFVSPFTPPLHFTEASRLPSKDARILRNVGLQANPIPPPPVTITPSTHPTSLNMFNLETDGASVSHSSTQTFKTTQTDISVLRRIRQPRRRFYNLGNRSSRSIARDLATSPLLFSRRGLKSAIQTIFRPDRNRQARASSSASSPLDSTSNITLPFPRSGTARNLTAGAAGERVGEFDVGALRRVRRQKERVDLRNGTCMGSFELHPRLKATHAHSRRQASSSTHGLGDEDEDEVQDAGIEADNEETETESSSSDFTVYSCASEGSEVEVDGGVALTEEAVETHTPDILVIPAPDAGSDDDDEVSEEEKGIDLTSLESIMAQM